MTTELITWLRAVADPIDQQLIDETFRYEYRIDGEWGCAHYAVEIEEGKCPEVDPDRLTAVRLVASRYVHVPPND